MFDAKHLDRCMDDETLEKEFIKLLQEELIPAEGCTEPIALAFCAAKARDLLATVPEKIIVHASGNIIKNVKSVIVPNTDGKKGIKTAAIYGAIAGHPDRDLEVLQDLDPAKVLEAERLTELPDYVEVRHLKTQAKLHIIVEVFAGEERALAEIRDTHTNIVRLEKNGHVLFQKTQGTGTTEGQTGMLGNELNLKRILEFASRVSIDKVKPIIKQQILYNSRIAEEGLSCDYGANVGKTLLEAYGSDLKTRCAAKAAAGSDARMSGAELPVVINSGSGNQGITVSLPVIEYARGIHADEEQLIRALLISNLTAIYQKAGIGRLSAYCGAVSAAVASMVAIAWLDGASYEVLEGTMKNALGNISGIVCDGAKPSCAAKIATSIQASFTAYEMAKHHHTFCGGDGIVKDSADQTVDAVGKMASQGMVQTDEEIIRIMIDE